LAKTLCYRARLEAFAFIFGVRFYGVHPFTTHEFGILGDRYDLVGIEALKLPNSSKIIHSQTSLSGPLRAWAWVRLSVFDAATTPQGG
jgi:hypothetical protein